MRATTGLWIDDGGVSALDESDFAGPGTLRRFFGGELYPLALTEQLEHGAPDGAAVEEMFGTAFITDEAETLVDQETSDRPVKHSLPLRVKLPGSARDAERPDGTSLSHTGHDLGSAIGTDPAAAGDRRTLAPGCQAGAQLDGGHDHSTGSDARR